MLPITLPVEITSVFPLDVRSPSSKPPTTTLLPLILPFTLPVALIMSDPSVSTLPVTLPSTRTASLALILPSTTISAPMILLIFVLVCSVDFFNTAFLSLSFDFNNFHRFQKLSVLGDTVSDFHIIFFYFKQYRSLLH